MDCSEYILKSLAELNNRISQIDKLARQSGNMAENMGRIQVHCDYAKEEIERIREWVNK